MRNAVCIISLALLPLTLFPQKRRLDSLELLLSQNSEQDTTRLNLLNELAYDYHLYDPEKGLLRANEAIELAVRLQQNKKLATAYQYKGHNYKAKGEDSLALKLYDKAILIHEKINNRNGVARTTFNKGLVYFGWSDYQKSTENYLKAYAIFEKEKDSFLMAKILNSIAINNMYVSDYPKALSKYLLASRIYENLGNTQSLEYAQILGNTGLVYYHLEKFESALKYQEMAMELYEKLDYRPMIASTLSNMGNIYDNMGQPERAIELQKEAYQINKSVQNKRGMASNLTNLGIAYTSLSKYPEALDYLNRTKMLYEELGDLGNLGIVHSYLGESYLNLSDNNSVLDNNFNTANAHFKIALQLAQQTGMLEEEGEIWEKITETYLRKKDYKNAFEAKNKAVDIKDSINSAERKEEIARLELHYEYDKKKAAIISKHDKEQAVFKMEVQRQRFINNGIIIGGGGLLLTALAGLYLYKRKRDAVAQKHEAEFNTKIIDTELKALRSQMNPHFIFNSLNSINSFITKNDKIAASDYLIKFAKLMRRTLENSEKREILIKEDLELLATYLEIEAKRLGNKFTFEIKVDKAIDTDNTLVPPLILQPFMENSIWHGIAPKHGAGHIVIDVQKKANMVVYSVDDDGVGRNKQNNVDKAGQNKSLGMKLTKSRIDIVNKRKNCNGNVRIIDKEEGVRVEIELPLQLAF